MVSFGPGPLLGLSSLSSDVCAFPVPFPSVSSVFLRLHRPRARLCECLALSCPPWPVAEGTEAYCPGTGRLTSHCPASCSGSPRFFEIPAALPKER